MNTVSDPWWKKIDQCETEYLQLRIADGYRYIEVTSTLGHIFDAINRWAVDGQMEPKQVKFLLNLIQRDCAEFRCA